MMAGITTKNICPQLLRAGLRFAPRVPVCCYSTSAEHGVKTSKILQEKQAATFGQPTPSTHPHLMQTGELTPGIQVEEFVERRSRLIDSIREQCARQDKNAQQHLVVIPSASKLYMTEKIPYVFRQNTDFLYLSGCLEPDSALVLSGGQAGGGDHTSTLFVQKRDSHSELWDGPRTGVEGAVDLFRVHQALPASQLQHFLGAFSKTHRSFMLWYDFMQPTQLDVHNTMTVFLGQAWSKAWESPKALIHHMRLYKSPAEIALMRSSCRIASDAIVSTIKSSRPGVTEHQLFARVDYECRMNGAEFLAYPPVVASGNRANIIHYINNNQRVQAGDMVLMDAGCEHHGYSSDITRTWPVSGKFTARQRELYEAVLSVQTDLIEQLVTLPTLDHLFHQMCALLGRRLAQLGFLPKTASADEMSRVAYSFCPHHVSHYLGMDVHDTATVSRGIKLAPGMIITVEPGVYVNPRNKTAPPEYQGLGVRIEDDVLITEDGPVVLTDPCPRQVEDIEKLFVDRISQDVL